MRHELENEGMNEMFNERYTSIITESGKEFHLFRKNVEEL